MAQISVVIDHTKVSADLTDFPVYINLADMPAAFWALVANGGGDIRCYKSDGTTELAREVVSCVTADDTGELYVKYTGTLSSSIDTEILIDIDGIRSDYAVTATYGRNAVWSEYFAVYHMQDSAAPMTDSTGAGYSLSDESSSPTEGATGKIGKGVDFDGGDAYSKTSFDMGAITNLTVTLWQKLDSLGNPGSYGTISYGTFTDATQQWPWMLDQRTGKLYAYLYKASGVLMEITGATTVTTGVWSNIGLTYTGSSGRGDVWLNGASDSNGTNASINNLFNTAADTLYVGRYENSFGDRFIDGIVDEIRIAKVLRNSSWMATEQNNQANSNTFYSASAVSTGVPLWGIMA